MDSFVSLPYNIVCNLKYRMCWHGWQAVYFPAQLWSYPRCIVALIRSEKLCSEENSRLRFAIVCRLHATCSWVCGYTGIPVSAFSLLTDRSIHYCTRLLKIAQCLKSLSYHLLLTDVMMSSRLLLLKLAINIRKIMLVTLFYTFVFCFLSNIEFPLWQNVIYFDMDTLRYSTKTAKMKGTVEKTLTIR